VIAAVNPNAQELGAWLISAAAVLAIVKMAFDLVKGAKRVPPIEAEFVTKLEFQRVHDHAREQAKVLSTELNTRLRELEVGMRTELRVMGEKIQDSLGSTNLMNERRAGDLHERINVISDRVAKLEGIVM
jgi:hypothetical protein